MGKSGSRSGAHQNASPQSDAADAVYEAVSTQLIVEQEDILRTLSAFYHH